LPLPPLPKRYERIKGGVQCCADGGDFSSYYSAVSQQQQSVCVGFYTEDGCCCRCVSHVNGSNISYRTTTTILTNFLLLILMSFLSSFTHLRLECNKNKETLDWTEIVITESKKKCV
jgi:hypothetical protein